MLGIIALSSLIGLVSGAVSGFVAAILSLQAKHVRNARLTARGEPAIRDAMLIKLHIPGGVLGLVIGGVAGAITQGNTRIVIASAVAPSLLLFVVMLVVIVSQAFSRMNDG